MRVNVLPRKECAFFKFSRALPSLFVRRSLLCLKSSGNEEKKLRVQIFQPDFALVMHS